MFSWRRRGKKKKKMRRALVVGVGELAKDIVSVLTMVRLRIGVNDKDGVICVDGW